jgi:hypothetical protein
MLRFITIILIAAVIAAGSSGIVIADDGNPEKASVQVSAAQEKWESLSPKEKQRLLENYEIWETLPTDRR